MPDYPDVLDHLGKTPREFGSVHIHIEPVPRAEDGYGLAVVWCQAAFAPIKQAARFEVLEHRSELPPLEAGVVMRGQVPLQIPSGTEKLLAVVTSDVHAKAERVRPAWKLFDTWEMPREERGGGDGGDLGFGAGLLMANAVALPLGFVVIPTGFGSGPPSQSQRVKITKANELPPGFVADVIRGAPERLTAPRWAEVWKPGQPLPAAALPSWGDGAVMSAQPGTPSGARRNCVACGFSGRREDFDSDRFCPQCGADWT